MYASRSPDERFKSFFPVAWPPSVSWAGSRFRLATSPNCYGIWIRELRLSPPLTVLIRVGPSVLTCANKIHVARRQEASTHEPVTAGPPVYLPLSVPVDTPASTIFALVIGIDKYNDKGVGNLHGCVADADGVQTFLIETLCVLPERILNLRNEGATRGEILKHVLNRATNTSIQEGDPILIYYAGHGGEANPPAGWAAGGEKIQMILPHDFIPRTSTSESSQGILDVTLSVLLNKLSRAKGNNISVIFDCCHSGSGTRIDEDMPSPLVRGVKLPDDYAILPMVDEQILSDEDRATCVAKKFEKAEMASHVLLAACRASELAHESNQHGDFTSALLALLRKDCVDRLTYEEAIMRLPDLTSGIYGHDSSAFDVVMFDLDKRHRWWNEGEPWTRRAGYIYIARGYIRYRIQDTGYTGTNANARYPHGMPAPHLRHASASPRCETHMPSYID
ncbi:caspase domain-containing protein [Amylostereum chailletii]|nr:caspase domain-containing protein [Amylostereum chailletii]